MTETEKMLAGKLYDPADDALTKIRTAAHDLCRQYNVLSESDPKRTKILKKLMPKTPIGEAFVYLQGPIQFDYGHFTTLGEGTYVNFNFTCVDCAPVTIGKNAFIGPNVSLLTPVHPMRYQERNGFVQEDGTVKVLEYARPIAIGDNCWLGGNVTVCGGATIGNGCVIGAGSVVTRDIPPDTFAVGVPCRPVRKITEKDAMKYHPECF